MANTKFTSGCRFAQIKFAANPHNPGNSEHSGSFFGPPSPKSLPLIDEYLSALMETLRQYINGVLRQQIPVQQRRRIVCVYWELEFLVEELRLQLDIRGVV